MHFLDYHAKIGTGYLHPGGEELTVAMINELQLTAYTRLLELGCGTGASIVKIVRDYRLNACACDVSDKMLKSAKQRAFFKQVLSHINFVKLKTDGCLPFEDNSFDAVYAESVLAIVDKDILPVILNEIARVLVSGGRLVTNDAIWKDGITLDEINRINGACLRDFGMLHSGSKPAVLQEWIEMFETTGLKVKKAVHQNAIATRRRPEPDFFSFYKKLFSPFSFEFILSRRRFNKALRGSHKKDADSLDNYLFVMVNRK